MRTAHQTGQALTEYVLVVSVLVLFLFTLGGAMVVAASEYVRSLTFLISLPIP